MNFEKLQKNTTGQTDDLKLTFFVQKLKVQGGQIRLPQSTVDCVQSRGIYDH